MSDTDRDKLANLLNADPGYGVRADAILAAWRLRLTVLVLPPDAFTLLAAVEAALALHQESTIGYHCRNCWYLWPCPTVRAINDALEGGE